MSSAYIIGTAPSGCMGFAKDITQVRSMDWTDMHTNMFKFWNVLKIIWKGFSCQKQGRAQAGSRMSGVSKNEQALWFQN